MNGQFEKISLPGVKHIIIVASGKGGVGKSTVAANLAISIAKQGFKTALVDADIYGPSIPMMFDLMFEKPEVTFIDNKQKVLPIEKYGIKIISIGFFVDPQQALIWRGPMASGTVTQLFSETIWEDIDYMIIDFPPGTGDIHLTVLQKLDIAGAIVVTTPQEIALADARKAINMFQNKDLNVRVLGIIENMSYFSPEPHPEEQYFIFGKGGGERLSKQTHVPLIGQIPFVMKIGESGEDGRPIAFEHSHQVAVEFENVSKKIISFIESRELTQIKTTNNMKIAVPVTTDNLVDSHFGHCDFFTIFTVNDKKTIIDIKTIESPQGCGCKSNIASTLSEMGVTVMLVGGIGGGAINVLNSQGIFVTRGCEGSALKAVNDFLEDKIADSGESCQMHEQHHGDGQEHECHHNH